MEIFEIVFFGDAAGAAGATTDTASAYSSPTTAPALSLHRLRADEEHGSEGEDQKASHGGGIGGRQAKRASSPVDHRLDLEKHCRNIVRSKQKQTNKSCDAA